MICSPLFCVQHAMVSMPLALVRLMAEYARADTIDYGDIFFLSNHTLHLFRMPVVRDRIDYNKLACLNELERKYDIRFSGSSSGYFGTIKIITQNFLLMPCSCQRCGCDGVAEANGILCDDCCLRCVCRECGEFVDNCECESEEGEGEEGDE